MVTFDRPIDSDEAFQTAFDGYLTGYPLIVLDAARRRHPGGPNRFVHVQPGEAIGLRSPNPHVVYSSAWLDLRNGPVVISLPELHARHVVMPMIDAWGEIFASLGVRRRGTGAQHLVVVGPTWSGASTDDLPVLRAPTSAVWLLGRTLVDPLDEGDQGPWNEYFLTPKCLRGGVVTDPPATDWEAWPDIAGVSDGEEFLDRMSALMGRHPLGAFRDGLSRRLARLGFRPAAPFRTGDLPGHIADAVNAGVAEAARQVEAATWPRPEGADHWVRLSRPGGGRLAPLERAAIMRRGFGFNLRDDAVYFLANEDGAGGELSGDGAYHLRFEPRRLPPVGACWSLAAYDLEGGTTDPVEGRTGLSSRDPLRFNPDGSLDIRVQNTRPSGPGSANWLPAPSAGFRLILRVWWPGEAVIDGRWNPPPIRRMSRGDETRPRRRLTASVGVVSGATPPRLRRMPDVSRDCSPTS
jgi:hypothetical protein